jgi:pyridoxal phosphate enzyme (YggS family)
MLRTVSTQQESKPIMSTTAELLQGIHDRIAVACGRAGRSPGEVQLVAVAKTATPETLREAWDAGQREFGHNRVQALEDHRMVLPQANWHLLGPLQGRKVRRGLAASSCFQALGDRKTAERCQRALEEVGRTDFPGLLQVNMHPEDGRYGCPLEELDGLLELVQQLDLLRCDGLMTLALADAPEAILRGDFSKLFERFHRLQEEGQLLPSARLSMGMSQDFETAIQEGANLVRVGRAIFPPET